VVVRIARHCSTSIALHCGIADFRRFTSISHKYSHWPTFTTLGEMADTDEIMNSQHFWSDPADIRINSEMWMPIRDRFWLRLDSLAEVCALWVQSIVIITIIIVISSSLSVASYDSFEAFLLFRLQWTDCIVRVGTCRRTCHMNLCFNGHCLNRTRSWRNRSI